MPGPNDIPPRSDLPRSDAPLPEPSRPDLPRPVTPRPGAPLPGERRRPGWREFRRSYPGVLATMVVALLVLVAMDAWLLHKRDKYRNEIARLRAGMSDVERRRTDMALKVEENRFKVMIELVRRQAALDKDLHLSVAVDSGVMYLEQGTAQLRVMPVQVGPERWVGAPPDTVKLAVPRGRRTIERVLGAKDPWEVPRWVYELRGLPIPEERNVVGALGAAAIVLNGGTVVYSMPSAGPLNDSTFVLPGGVRARARDLAAVLPNLHAGQTIYFY